VTGNRECVGNAAGAEDAEDAVGVAQGVGAQGDAADRELDDVAVAEDGRAHGAGHVFELLLPVVGVGIGNRLFADHAVEDQVEEAVFGADVPVQRGGGGVQRARDMAHAEQIEAVGVQHLERGVDDRLLAERVGSPARRTLRYSRPGWRGKVGAAALQVLSHLNTVQVSNGLRMSRHGW
jgi:hypothetical protein